MVLERAVETSLMDFRTMHKFPEGTSAEAAMQMWYASVLCAMRLDDYMLCSVLMLQYMSIFRFLEYLSKNELTVENPHELKVVLERLNNPNLTPYIPQLNLVCSSLQHILSRGRSSDHTTLRKLVHTVDDLLYWLYLESFHLK